MAFGGILLLMRIEFYGIGKQCCPSYVTMCSVVKDTNDSFQYNEIVVVLVLVVAVIFFLLTPPFIIDSLIWVIMWSTFFLKLLRPIKKL